MKKFRGFTLAEVLITLAIIGVVAAITLPSLLVNVNEKAWDAQKKALHARLAQAIGQMNTLGGYGTYTEDEEGTATVDTAAESFILDALSKVYKINNVCGADKLSACGVPSKIVTLDGEKELNFPTKISELNEILLNGYKVLADEGDIKNTKAAAFETVNGESVAVFYNPYCGVQTQQDQYIQNKMCVNFIYDLNGVEGPNKVGKDVGFITAFYRKNPIVVAPIPYNDFAANGAMLPQVGENSSALDAVSACKMQSEDLRLPNREEASSMFINKTLINKIGSVVIWSSSIISLGDNAKGWAQNFDVGHHGSPLRKAKANVYCIKK